MPCKGAALGGAADDGFRPPTTRALFGSARLVSCLRPLTTVREGRTWVAGSTGVTASRVLQVPPLLAGAAVARSSTRARNRITKKDQIRIRFSKKGSPSLKPTARASAIGCLCRANVLSTCRGSRSGRALVQPSLRREQHAIEAAAVLRRWGRRVVEPA